MKELFIKILRFLMFVLVVALGCIGYNIYEDTLAAVWIPVGVGLVVAVVTLPLYKGPAAPNYVLLKFKGHHATIWIDGHFVRRNL